MSALEVPQASIRTTYSLLRVVHERVALRPQTWSETADMVQVRDEMIRELAARGQSVFLIVLRGGVPARVVRVALAGTRWSPWGAR